MAKKNNDNAILALKAKIEEKKKLIKKSEKFTPITNCSLLLNGERFNLNVLGKDSLVFLGSSLQAIKNASLELFPEEDLIISGFTVDQWLTDIKSKFSNITIKLEENKLKALEDRLHNLLSTDKKVELELGDIAKMIN